MTDYLRAITNEKWALKDAAIPQVISFPFFFFCSQVHLPAKINQLFLHNFQWITIPTHLSLLSYSFLSEFTTLTNESNFWFVFFKKAYQTSWIISYQIHPSRRTIVVPFRCEDKGAFIPSPKGIYPKMNLVAWLEFELAYYNSAVQHFNNYTTMSSPPHTFLIFWEIGGVIILK